MLGIEKVCGNFNAKSKQEPSLVLYWLLGKVIEGIDEEKMNNI